MTVQIESIIGHRGLYRGIFCKYGSESLWHKPEYTLILSHVLSVDHHKFVMDAVVLTLKGSNRVYSFEKGDIVEFRAKMLSTHKFTPPKKLRKLEQIPLAFKDVVCV